MSGQPELPFVYRVHKDAMPHDIARDGVRIINSPDAQRELSTGKAGLSAIGANGSYRAAFQTCNGARLFGSLLHTYGVTVPEPQQANDVTTFTIPAPATPTPTAPAPAKQRSRQRFGMPSLAALNQGLKNAAAASGGGLGKAKPTEKRR